MAAAMDLVRDDLARRGAGEGTPIRSVVMAHAFVGRAAEAATRSESERDLRVGGVELVPSSIFGGITYTALGHLHGAQEPRLDGEGYLRYSGSPLRYSFSEAAHDKSVTIVDLGMDGLKSVSTVPVPQPRPMAELTGTLSELLEGAAEGHEESWVKAVVTDATRPDHMYQLLRTRFPHLLSAHHRPADAPDRVVGVDAATTRDPLDVVAAFVAEAGGAPITDDELAAVREVYEALLRKEGSDR
jgi:exonuclease SbcD